MILEQCVLLGWRQEAFANFLHKGVEHKIIAAVIGLLLNRMTTGAEPT